MKLSAEQCSVNCEKKPEIHSGQVMNIQRFSLHDGPGVRTVVFLKGCQMSCIWCANPESQSSEAEILFDQQRCNTYRAKCRLLCPARNGMNGYDVERWPSEIQCSANAFRLSGQKMTVDSVIKQVLSDELHYRTSGGGMTLSGGEVAMQPEFARALLQSASQFGIHGAIETAGFASWRSLWRVCEASKLILYDLKMVDDVSHQRYTGVSNRSVLSNLKRLLREDVPIRLRIPVIPFINDTAKEADALMMTIRRMTESSPSFEGVDLLPYHSFGQRKYTLLGRQYPYRQHYPLTQLPKTGRLIERAHYYGMEVNVLSNLIG
ncbi:MAG: glycyl-radical enzyme activating protein [Pantoea sp.]|uniref:glycyl-radical enzyme activating protein n=1 Tax=Pantoea sp. TaxID=69393 RepID=UPI00239F71A4|nr:glycyl-radical enzyme activating protein [Pantoea sp.]MDE1185464.1 glycyl-radical enzyme activating protein [Pantoea sp.]